LLALTLALGLSTRASDEGFLLLLGKGFGVGPLLVLLAAFVWLAGFWDSGAKVELLLGLLGEVISVRDAVVFWLWLSCRERLELLSVGVDWSIGAVTD
jgi:hypothetical protein